MSTMNPLTQRDQEILQALVQKVRLFSQRQVADHWYNGETANARRRLKALARSGLVQSVTVCARTLPPIESPLVTWQPGQNPPELGTIAYALQQRWKRRAVRRTCAFLATDRAAQLYGGRARGELKHPSQATHDLGLAAVWLRLVEQAPAWAHAWRSEDLLAHTRRGEKLPDAFIVDGTGKTLWVIEFGGAYDTVRLQEFHADCLSRNLPYQVW